MNNSTKNWPFKMGGVYQAKYKRYCIKFVCKSWPKHNKMAERMTQVRKVSGLDQGKA